MNLLGKNISANLLSNLWLAFLLLLVTPIYISFLGVESYGLVGFYISWVAILGILDTGISATAMREIAWLEARPQEIDQIPVLLRSLEVVYWTVILIFGAAILTGAVFFGADWFQESDLKPEIVRETMILMALSLVVQVPSGLYSAGLMGLQRQVECSGFLAFFGTLRALGAIALLGLVAADIRVFFLWQLVVSALQTGIIRRFLWKRVRIDERPVKFSLETIKSIKGFASGMILITGLSIMVTQFDKMILSRMVSLELFGFYILAWTVASGLSRLTTPLTQAFFPRFTELVSKEDSKSLAKQFHLASQLTSLLILPPIALLGVLSKPILFVWTGSQTVAEGASQILACILVGTVLVSSSQPATSILYSKKLLGPVINVQFTCFVVLLPLLVVLVNYFGVMGAVFIWGLYGFTLYVIFQLYMQKTIPEVDFFSSILNDFFIPLLASLIVAGMAGQLLSEVTGRIYFIVLAIFVLVVSWVVTLMVSKVLFKIILEQIKVKWKTKTIL